MYVLLHSKVIYTAFWSFPTNIFRINSGWNYNHLLSRHWILKIISMRVFWIFPTGCCHFLFLFTTIPLLVSSKDSTLFFFDFSYGYPHLTFLINCKDTFVYFLLLALNGFYLATFCSTGLLLISVPSQTTLMTSNYFKPYHIIPV